MIGFADSGKFFRDGPLYASASSLGENRRIQRPFPPEKNMYKPQNSIFTSRPLPFHRLDVYRVALDLVRLAGGLHPHRGTADIREQFRRSSSSCALNVAEANR